MRTRGKAVLGLVLLAGLSGAVSGAGAATMNDYCMQPPFVAQAVPPLVMFEVGREHKLYYEAYNDAADIDEDGRLDTTYKHSIDYYGYFDPKKCYTYDSTGTAKFVPASVTADIDTDASRVVYSKFCSAGQWSGNILNWLSMSRMDVLRKVLYGGHRSADSSSSTVLERVYIPQDAHSWGKEVTGRLCYNASAAIGSQYTNMCMTNGDCATGYTCTDKSNELIGIAASDAPVTATVDTVAWDKAAQILLVKYSHTNTLAGNNHTELMNSYQPANLLTGFPVYINDFNDTNIEAKKDHGNYHNFFAVTEFQVPAGNTGTWEFVVDGDDGVELEIAGTVIASYYGGHGACYAANKKPKDDNTGICSAPMRGSVSLTAGQWYRLIARHTEVSGEDSVRVWYKKPGDAAWSIFGNSLTLRSPNITSSVAPSIMTADFIQTGTPTPGTFVTGSAKRHLFCSTSLGNGSNDPPVLRRLQNMSNRVWDWVSKERPVCDTSLGTPTDFQVRVEVCKSGLMDDNCVQYGGGSNAYKPKGLLQKYGERLGGSVCSKTMSKSCNSDNDCSLGTEGICVEKALMYFGLFTDSYTKNLSGGVLRKNIGTISDETQTNGIFQSSENARGNIILSLDRMKTVGFNYSSYAYDDSSGGSCGWITSRTLNEGECRMWGNPIGEMMYETLRYLAGKGAATSEFTYTTNDDSGVTLSKPAWGYKDGSNTYQLYDIFPPCAKPFMLILSDINTSYDSDQIPGSSYTKPDGTYFAEDNASPQLGLGTLTSGTSLLNTLTDTIGADEGIAGNNWFVGQSGTLVDFICTSKTVSKLSLIRGMCPEEPTKRGSYYAAALAYYGRTLMKAKTGKPDVFTYVVALSSPVADMKVKVGGKTITLVPFGKSVSGDASVYENCFSKCTVTSDTNGLHFSNCAADAFCPTNQIVDFYVDTLNYDVSNNITYAKFRINFEDVEQGADHDMDAIVTYELTPVGSDKLEVRLSSDYAAGGIDQVMGFVISGTDGADGVYLPVRDKDMTADGNTPSTVANLPLEWSKTFTVSSGGTATTFLKNPLWLAAKWGGFTDANGNGKPDLKVEWDKDNDGNPDNYFLVVNPLKLEQQLDKALSDILARVSSGTAASILSNNDNNGANLLQAVFYPRKIFSDETSADWIGELQDLWYYIDPFLQNSTIREDSVSDNLLKLKQDYVTRFFFDTTTNQTRVNRYLDADGNGSGETFVDTVAPEEVKSLWKAGELLWSRNLTDSPRTIKTHTAGTLIDFSTGNHTALRPLLQAADTAEADKIINYVHGVDYTGYRSRTVSNGTISHVWKLGDIVSSTPRLQSSVRLNAYHLDKPSGYRDYSYASYLDSTNYKDRGMAYVGGNDGMLHAFKLGLLAKGATAGVTSQITGTELGKEEWAFIPKNSLPYLRYLTCKAGGNDSTYCQNLDYNHLYYVNLSPTLLDASIATTSGTGCTDSAYWNCDKKTTYASGTSNLDLSATSWRTILIGGMGLGGASRNSTTSGTGDFVKTPIDGVGYSSYFALDVTNPSSPSLLWEFSDAALGYSTTGPAIVRVGDAGKNGRWFAVFASGPTGPIDTTIHQFKGRSNQELKIFVVDLRTGALVKAIPTGITEAFAGSLSGAAIDTDRATLGGTGNYSDDALYFGFVKKDTTTSTWTKGGVLRVQLKDDINPDNWVVSKVIDNIGPVTSAVAKIQDTSPSRKKLWLYFGTGRFYYKAGSDIDDADSVQALYGLQEPCYADTNDMDTSCATTLTTSNLINKTTDNLTDAIPSDKKGWFINLAGSSTGYKAQRSITDPVAASNGAVFFTTFKPTADICGFGGNSSLWGVRYDTGGPLGRSAMQGSALIQVSTGSFEEKYLPYTFINSGGRESDGFQGIPPEIPPAIVSNAGMKPLKRIMHIQER
ncbi:MAG: pilus assembly protein PilY [Desulfuromonadales bacterium]|nr:MAG: pilus assembly protein PilY [Desulfuromonadales bacterium]